MEKLSQIIQGCKSQDSRSQEKLYKEYYPAFYTLCREFFQNPEDILTALNNGMIRVFKTIDQYDESKGSIFNWMYTLIRYAALTHLKTKKEDRHIFLEHIQDIDTYNPFEEKQWDQIFDLLEKLPPSTRAICSLFYIEGFAIKEIASSISIKEGTIKWHLNAGRNRLKEIINLNPLKGERA